MSNGTLFCHLSSKRIAKLIRAAKSSVCYAGPGIQLVSAKAMIEVAENLGPEVLTVSLDFNENVMRMGYGDIESVKRLKGAGIIVNHAPDLRSALIIVDGEGYIFTPTPLYLEAESSNDEVRNALRLTREQVAEALARLSPAAKAIAVAQADNQEEKLRIQNIPVEVISEPVSEECFNHVEKELELAPPVKFDLARQVRVFEPYLQYVELKLTGAAIQRRKLAIPSNIQKLGGSKELVSRLHTNFDLIEKGSKLSSKPLEDTLNEIRKNFTPSLGSDHGRVVLKSAKPHLIKRLEELQKDLDSYQREVKNELQEYLDKSREQVVDYYLPLVQKTPPDALIGQLLSSKPTEDDVRLWLNSELENVFPAADSLISKMKLDEKYKDVTYETLNRDDFLVSVKKAFPRVDWDKAYEEFRAVGESNNK